MRIIISEDFYNRITEREQDVDFIEIAHAAFNEIHEKLKKMTQQGYKSFEQIKSDVDDGYSRIYLRKDSVILFYTLASDVLEDNTIMVRIINKQTSALGSAIGASNVINLYGYKDSFEEFVRNVDKLFDARESTFVHELGHLMDYKKSKKIFRKYKSTIKSPIETRYKSNEIYKRAVERYNKLGAALQKRFNQYKQQNAETSVIYYESLYNWYRYSMEDHKDRLNDWNDEKDFYLKEYSEFLGYEVSEEEGFKYYLSSNPYLCDLEWVSRMVYNEYAQNVGYKFRRDSDSNILPKREKAIRSRVYTFFSKLAEKLEVDCSKKINWDD